MKRILKSALGIVATAAIALSIPTRIGAEGLAASYNENVDNKLSMKQQISSLLSVSCHDMLDETSTIIYGSKIPVYNYDAGLLSKSDKLTFYPVYINDTLCGYVRETINNGVSYLSYSNEFVTDVLSFALAKYNFICTDSYIYVSSNNNLKKLGCISMGFDSKKNEDRDYECLMESIDGFAMEFYDISCKENKIDISDFINSKSDPILYWLDDIQPWEQPYQSGLCWAGSVEAVGEHISNNYNYSPSDIATIMGIGSEGAYNYQVKNALSSIYNVSTDTSESIPSYSYIVYKIGSGNGKPIIAGLQSTSAGHYMTIIGYGTDCVNNHVLYYVKVMDTIGGTYRTKQLVNGVFSVSYGGEIFTWDSAIIPS